MERVGTQKLRRRLCASCTRNVALVIHDQQSMSSRRQELATRSATRGTLALMVGVGTSDAATAATKRLSSWSSGHRWPLRRRDDQLDIDCWSFVLVLLITVPSGTPLGGCSAA